VLQLSVVFFSQPLEYLQFLSEYANIIVPLLFRHQKHDALKAVAAQMKKT
jgi:hypothetical protein